MTIEWAEVAHEFAPDGSLRDIYVLGTDLQDWDAVLELVRARYAPLFFTVNGAPAPIPDRAAEAFAIAAGAAVLLNFSVGGIDMACHFFTAEEIEFDLSPRAVGGPAQLCALVDFLRRLATRTGKAAVLTGENVPEAVILRADPAGDTVTYGPGPDAPAI